MDDNARNKMLPAGKTDFAPDAPRHILITGLPGSGKTILVRTLAEAFAPFRPAGFFTEEICKHGKRRGFRLVGLDGSQRILAHQRFRPQDRVGRYGVDVAGFEYFLSVLQLTSTAAHLVFLDEIGKMECLSGMFRRTVRDLLDSRRTVVATVALRGAGLIAEVKQRPDCRLVALHPRARREILWDVTGLLRGILGIEDPQAVWPPEADGTADTTRLSPRRGCRTNRG